MSSIGTKIAFYRKAQNMTQEQLAEKMGVSAQAVSKWENDIACPDIQLLVPLTKLLGTTTDELLSADSIKSVQFLSENLRRDTKDLTLKVTVDSNDGDKIRINLPMDLIKVALALGMKIPQIASNELLKNINFDQIFTMAENGVTGKLVEVESSDGDIVNVVVE